MRYASPASFSLKWGCNVWARLHIMLRHVHSAVPGEQANKSCKNASFPSGTRRPLVLTESRTAAIAGRIVSPHSKTSTRSAPVMLPLSQRRGCSVGRRRRPRCTPELSAAQLSQRVLARLATSWPGADAVLGSQCCAHNDGKERKRTEQKRKASNTYQDLIQREGSYEVYLVRI